MQSTTAALSLDGVGVSQGGAEVITGLLAAWSKGDEKALKELAANLKEVGVIQPIVVRKVGDLTKRPFDWSADVAKVRPFTAKATLAMTAAFRPRQPAIQRVYTISK